MSVIVGDSRMPYLEHCTEQSFDNLSSAAPCILPAEMAHQFLTDCTPSSHVDIGDSRVQLSGIAVMYTWPHIHCTWPQFQSGSFQKLVSTNWLPCVKVINTPLWQTGMLVNAYNAYDDLAIMHTRFSCTDAVNEAVKQRCSTEMASITADMKLLTERMMKLRNCLQEWQDIRNSAANNKLHAIYPIAGMSYQNNLTSRRANPLMLHFAVFNEVQLLKKLRDEQGQSAAQLVPSATSGNIALTSVGGGDIGISVPLNKSNMTSPFSGRNTDHLTKRSETASSTTAHFSYASVCTNQTPRASSTVHRNPHHSGAHVTARPSGNGADSLDTFADMPVCSTTCRMRCCCVCVGCPDVVPALLMV